MSNRVRCTVIYVFQWKAKYAVSFMKISCAMACEPWIHNGLKPTQVKPNANTWWRHQMETFSALLALCARNSPVTGEFHVKRPVTRSFDVFFDLRLNKQLSKQSWCWWFETPSRSLWRQCNDSLPHSHKQTQFSRLFENASGLPLDK